MSIIGKWMKVVCMSLIEKCMQNCMHVIDRKVYAKLYACH